VFKGRSAISSLYEEVDFKAFPDAKVSIDNQAISGNLVITEWSYGGTNTGQLTLADGSTAPATGKWVSGRGVNVAEYGEDGLIKSERFYFDLMELLVQLGLVPTAARP
jgi:predicted ester cyclase